MNPLFREFVLLWLHLRLLGWNWALREIDPCHPDVPYLLRSQWGIADRINALKQERRS